MGKLRRTWLKLVSPLAWSRPGAERRFLASFSETERGSAVDMLAAAELTERRDLRRKYFIHALDETRHARLFARRAGDFGAESVRARAALNDANTLQAHGIVGGRSLFERYGELEFLAFVHRSEALAVEQFGVYHDLELLDEKTDQMLQNILRDEHFHVGYSRTELERYTRSGKGADVQRALRKVFWRRPWEAWMRFSVQIGHVVTSFWMTVLYLVVVAPFKLGAARERPGFRDVPPDPRSRMTAARGQG
ncbi:MAG: hypothetical protein CL927_07410 [Deltaproteobacteria bacterium]|nr:hypothetical protein [Deltaproteobacteria bacterium]HCH63833.1 hypothetical protein [Deltaproteobacteria bacterium]